MKEDRQGLKFQLVLGTVGTILIAIGAMRYLVKEHDPTGYVLLFLGFILTIGYINYLEKRAGISKRLTWIRVIVSIILFTSICFFLYF